MTLPLERARSLRWGWEFLWELKAATNITPAQRANVLNILDHYPSTSEITEWANQITASSATGLNDIARGAWLNAEDPDQEASKPQPGVPLVVDRAPITSVQRIEALAAASSFFRIDLRGCENLTTEQNRALMFVCRHFPLAAELEAIARRNALGKQGGSVESDFVRRGTAAINRTVSNNDGVPAETVITELKTKLAAARKSSRS